MSLMMVSILTLFLGSLIFLVGKGLVNKKERLNGGIFLILGLLFQISGLYHFVISLI